MIAPSFLAMLLLAAEPVAHTSFVCQEDNGRPFSVLLMSPPDGASVDDARALYRVIGLREAESADTVRDSLPDFLMLVWQRQDGTEITLEIENYDAETKTAHFRLARESDPSAPIVTKSFSNGRCLSRVVTGDEADNREETPL